MNSISRNEGSSKRRGSQSSSELDTEEHTCPICLGPFRDLSLIENCYHGFCFSCISNWAEKSRECPLCKRSYKAVFHNFSEKSSKIYSMHFFPSLGNTLQSSASSSSSTFQNDRIISRRQEIYALKLYPSKAKELISSLTKSSLEWVKYQDERVSNWINRDLIALFPGINVELIRIHIITCLKRGSNYTYEQIEDSIREYLGDNTEHFMLELALFLKSKLTIEAYDKLTKYETEENFMQ